MQVPITRIDRSLPLPTYGSEGAAGFDFTCRVDMDVPPGELARIPANVVVRVPDGYALIIALRSGTPARKGLLSPGGVGVVDRDFCGPDDEIAIQVFNFTDKPVRVERGERIAQGLLVPVESCEWEETAPTSESSRGGFGSTG